MSEEEKSAYENAAQTLAKPLTDSLLVVTGILGASFSPVLPILLAAAFGLHGYYLCYKQEELNSFVEGILPPFMSNIKKKGGTPPFF